MLKKAVINFMPAMFNFLPNWTYGTSTVNYGSWLSIVIKGFISKLISCCQITNPLALLECKALTMLQQATKNYQRLKPQHELLWSEFLQLCLHDPTLTDQHHQAIAQLVLLESLWDSYQHIWVLCNTQTGHSIVAVEYPTLAGTAIATSRDEVEQVLSKALSSWFTTAHVSPFLHAPLVPLVGPYGTGSTAQEILQGTFTCPPGTDETTIHPSLY